MASVQIKAMVRRALDVVFGKLGELVVSGTFRKITGYVTDTATGVTTTTVSSAPVSMLIVAYQSHEVNGSDLKFGDEKVLIRASELATIRNPAQDDWIVDAGNVRRDVKTAFLDATRQLWIFQTRRALPGPITGTTNSLDWGEIALQADSDEGWGDLALADAREDWGE